MKIFTFIVSGHNAFPLDMLRYDKCWPSNSEEVYDLTEGYLAELKSIHLASHYHPTVARWESFGWTVNKIEKLRV